MFSVAAFFTALLFWFSDSSIHYFVYREPHFELFPDNFNELWMRITIIVLIIIIGIFSDSLAKKMLISQKQLEANRIYNSMIYAAHHILNNLLNQMQLVKIEALRSQDFNQDIIEKYDSAIDEAKDLIDRLSRVENITEGNIWASVDPNNTGNLATKANSADAKTGTVD